MRTENAKQMIIDSFVDSENGILSLKYERKEEKT